MQEKERNAVLINRREAIRRVSALLGGVALVGGNAFLNLGMAESGSDTITENTLFSPDEIAFLDEVAETILPATETPGAKAAGVGPFMALMVTEVYDEDQQKIFREGMDSLDVSMLDKFGTSFMSATKEQQLALLNLLDREQVDAMKKHTDGESVHYFRMMKELTLLGYFTSEIGCTQAMRYIESPGRYDPCAPYEPGEKAWASHA